MQPDVNVMTPAGIDSMVVEKSPVETYRHGGTLRNSFFDEEHESCAVSE